MIKRKINAKDLIQKIEKLAKGRMASQEIVSLDQFRDMKKKIDPKVILVIEDEESQRASLKRIFETDGFIVKAVADGMELTQVLEDATPDLIVMDIGLPWLNGFELGTMLKEHKDLKQIPLIFISASSSEDDMKKAFEIGADDYVKKPFEIEKLKKTVMALLKISAG